MHLSMRGVLKIFILISFESVLPSPLGGKGQGEGSLKPFTPTRSLPLPGGEFDNIQEK